MSRLHVKRDDQVMVLGGKDRGKTGRVLRVLPREGKVIIENVNFVKRATRPNPSKNVKGGMVEKERPIDLSNVMLVCRECGAHARVGYSTLQDGRKVRICKKCNGTMDK